MSCTISLQTPQSVIVLTDGAVYDREHVLRVVERKVRYSERAPIAVATRGCHRMGQIAAEFIIAVVEDGGFDYAMDVLKHRAMSDYALFSNRSNAFEVLIAGISEEHGPRHLFFQNVPNFGLPPLKLLHPGTEFVGGSDNQAGSIHEKGIRRRQSGESLEAYMEAVGADIMELSRKTAWSEPDPWDLPGTGHRYIVGGHCDMTVVSGDGVKVQRLRTWDDKIGEKVNPFVEHENVTPLANRRSAEQPLPAPKHLGKRAKQRSRRA